MFLLLLLFPLLTLIISTQYFIYPFIANILLPSSPPICVPLRCHGWYSISLKRIVLLDKSIDSSTVYSLRFCHSESNSNTEGDISWDDGAISVDEEIREEAWWIGYLGVVHPSRWCILCTNCCFVVRFPQYEFWWIEQELMPSKRGDQTKYTT